MTPPKPSAAPTSCPASSGVVKKATESQDTDHVQINPFQYIDNPEPIAKGPSGCPADDLVQSLAICCHRCDDLKKNNMFHCVGTSTGCTTVWKGKKCVKMQITSHAVTCEHIPHNLWKRIDSGLALQALSAKILASDTSGSMKKLTSSPSGSLIGIPVARGSAKWAADLTQPSIFPLVKKAWQTELANQLDADIVSFFCVDGIPPSKVDIPEWKQMWAHAVPSYTPASSSKLEEYHIPSEAALVRSKQLEHLRTCVNLSIMFNGQTTHRPESVYTIHIITPDQLVFLFNGNKASDELHTANHLFLILDDVSYKWYFLFSLTIPTGNTTGWPSAVFSHMLR